MGDNRNQEDGSEAVSFVWGLLGGLLALSGSIYLALRVFGA